MWAYQKRLQYPVNIKTTNPKLAQYIVAQYGGPNGELAASLRYLSQRYSMPDEVTKSLLTDIGTEELAHLEIVGTIVRQLAKNATTEEIENSPFGQYFMKHGRGVYPADSTGVPFDAMAISVSADPIADLVEDLAAEQKARTTYDNLLTLIDDPDIREPLKFLRAREIVHYQRFGEALRLTTDRLDSKNFYAFNPSFIPGKK